MFAQTIQSFIRVQTLAIALITEATIRSALQGLRDAGSGAIVSIGPELLITRLVDETERWLDIPVLAVNAVMLRHALRARDIATDCLVLGLSYASIEHRLQTVAHWARCCRFRYQARHTRHQKRPRGD